MPNVAQGATASYTFPTAQTVTFTLDQGERAVINVTRSGALIANRSISNGETVGPYQAGDVMSVTALRGAVDYVVATYTSPVSGDGKQPVLTSAEVVSPDAALRASGVVVAGPDGGLLRSTASAKVPYAGWAHLYDTGDAAALSIAAGAAPNDASWVNLVATPGGVTTTASASPICGWGAVHTFAGPDPITHFVIPQLGQTASGAAQQWAYLTLTVQDGSSAGAVLATARFSIPAYKTPLSNIVFALSASIDPATTTSDRYFVAVEAYSHGNVRVPCGYCWGWTALSKMVSGSGVYKSTAAPTIWAAGAPATAYDAIIFLPATSARQAAKIAAQTAPVIVLPPIWAVAGRECNIYFDGLIRGNYRALDWDVTCSIGTQQAERWTVVPASAGTQAITVDALHPSTAEVVASASSTVTIAAAAAAFTAQLLVIGDSTTEGGETTGELLTLDAADANTSLTLLGTQGGAGNLHEGRAGWNAATFTVTGSPFFISGAVNMSSYLTTNSFTGITHCVIALGINDVFNAATDTALTTAINSYMTGVAKMVQGLQAFSGTMKIGIALTIPPSFSQDAFGANYGSGQTRARYRRNWHGLIREIQRVITTAGLTNVTLLPYSCSLATEANMATTTVAVNSRNAATVVRQSNGVHPASSGYLQLADVVWAWLKNNP